MRRLDSAQADFEVQITALLRAAATRDEALAKQVADIIQAVRGRGDAALLEYTRALDGLDVTEPGQLEVAPARMAAALDALDADQRDALEQAAERIRAYAAHQKVSGWQYQDTHGNTLGQLVRPLERVGVYAPGGRAAYPSSVLMNAVPAQVAGVDEIILVSPAAKGQVNPLVLAAAAVAGVNRMFTIGGAQAVAALAFGTATVHAVDKIVGPGNAWVAAAKRQVYGQVGIDMIAGPSEVLIIGDGSVDPDWIALDLFAQAEHDEDARALLLGRR
ncbi:MAG: histidinol dehydrogenase, partial [Salinisphaera sp.]|nr:histidinol dehydrogenase [Salinisphaera sp.]